MFNIIVFSIVFGVLLVMKHTAVKATRNAYKQGFVDGVKYQQDQDRLSYKDYDERFLKETKIKL